MVKPKGKFYKTGQQWKWSRQNKTILNGVDTEVVIYRFYDKEKIVINSHLDRYDHNEYHNTCADWNRKSLYTITAII